MVARRMIFNTKALRRTHDLQIPRVKETPVRCPSCGSIDNKVTGTRVDQKNRQKQRYRVCKTCGQSFTSWSPLQ